MNGGLSAIQKFLRKRGWKRSGMWWYIPRPGFNRPWNQAMFGTAAAFEIERRVVQPGGVRIIPQPEPISQPGNYRPGA